MQKRGIKIANKKNKRLFYKKVFKIIAFILICLLIGFFLGYLSAKFSDQNVSLFSIALKILAGFIILIVSYLVHIIIHELGHLVFGLASGYSFVSFRIGSFIIIKENGKLKRKKYSIPGTAGQCLMMPPDLKDGKYPFIIYNFGGVIMNIIFSTIAILSLIFIKAISYPLNLILILFALAGIFAALTNGIPFKIAGIANDAYNVKSMIKDEEAKRGFYLQLRVYGLLSNGMRFRDMDHSLFQLKEGSDITNPLNTGIRLMEYNWFLDNMDFENARKCIDSLVPYFHKLLPLYTYEINCERMFLELIGECNKTFIDRLYTDQLEKYIKDSRFMLSKKRLLLAYEAFYNEDKEEALIHYEEFINIYKNYPINGDADMELMIADWIKGTLR